MHSLWSGEFIPAPRLRGHNGDDTQKALCRAKISVKNAVYERATETLELVGGMMIEMGSDDR